MKKIRLRGFHSDFCGGNFTFFLFQQNIFVQYLKNDLFYFVDTSRYDKGALGILYNLSVNLQSL